MGMYNEVFCRCPKCGKRGYMQIHQIVLGFGGFDLNDDSTVSELNNDQLIELQQAVSIESFACKLTPNEETDNYFRQRDNKSLIPEGCGHTFNPITGEGYIKASDSKLRQLFPYLNTSSD